MDRRTQFIVAAGAGFLLAGLVIVVVRRRKRASEEWSELEARRAQRIGSDRVDEASQESFPASDPPAW